MPTSTRPTGRDNVRAAVLDAAVRLYARSGPSAVSLRDIAAEANVNLGLLHRHFGSKAEVVAAAMQVVISSKGAELAAACASDDLAREAAIFAVDPPSQAYVRMLAWSLLDGVAPVQRSHPAAEALITRFLEEGRSEAEARRAASGVIALIFGWSLFAPHLIDATGTSGDGTELAALIDGLLAA